MEVQRLCQYCGVTFISQKTTTRFCSHKCSKRAYKENIRTIKIEKNNAETKAVRLRPMAKLMEKEYLTVPEAAQILDCNSKSIYRLIESGRLSAVNLGQRLTRVRRRDMDKLFEQPTPPPESILEQLTRELTKKQESVQFDVSEFYTITEVQEKYGVSDRGLHEILKRNGIPKIKMGWYVYVPKTIIDKILS